MAGKELELTVKIKASGEDYERLAKRAYADGISLEELLERFIADLAGGKAASGPDESRLAGEWYDRHFFTPPQEKSFAHYLVESGLAFPGDVGRMLHSIDSCMFAYDRHKKKNNRKSMGCYEEYILEDVAEIVSLYEMYRAECGTCGEFRQALEGIYELTVKEWRMLGQSGEMPDYFTPDYWERLDGYVRTVREMEGEAG